MKRIVFILFLICSFIPHTGLSYERYYLPEKDVTPCSYVQVFFHFGDTNISTAVMGFSTYDLKTGQIWNKDSSHVYYWGARSSGRDGSTGEVHYYIDAYYDPAYVPPEPEPVAGPSVSSSGNGYLIGSATIVRADYSGDRKYQLIAVDGDGQEHNCVNIYNVESPQVDLSIRVGIDHVDPADLDAWLARCRVMLYVGGSRVSVKYGGGSHIDYDDPYVFPDTGVNPTNPNDPPDLDLPDTPEDPFGEDPVTPIDPVDPYNPTPIDPVDPYVPPSDPELPSDPGDPVSPDNPVLDPDPVDLVGIEKWSTPYWLARLQLSMVDLSDRFTDFTSGFGDGNDGSGVTNGASGGNVFIKGLDGQVYAGLYDLNKTATEVALENQNLSSEQIALRINDVLESHGLDSGTTKIVVQEALNNQGLSDYKIGIAVQDALYQSGNWGEDNLIYYQGALQEQKLSAYEIALEIKSALNSMGLSAEGIENGLRTVFEDRDISARNFQVAFEASLENKGMTANNLEIGSERALANRNLSAGQIGQEVGDQLRGLGLSTRANDDRNTDRIVEAIEGISVGDNSASASVLSNLVSGSVTSNSIDLVSSDYDESGDYDTNDIPSFASKMSGDMDTIVDSVSGWVREAFVFEKPSIGTAESFTVDFNSWGVSYDMPSYTMDLSISPITTFRAFECFLVYLFGLFSAIKIFRDTLMG